MRSNMHAGGKAHPVKVTDEMLQLVEMVRPKLIEDGMFLVGLDIVGDKLMEVNVFTPGGLGSCQQLYDVDFTQPVIEALERKVELRAHYGPTSTTPASPRSERASSLPAPPPPPLLPPPLPPPPPPFPPSPRDTDHRRRPTSPGCSFYPDRTEITVDGEVLAS